MAIEFCPLAADWGSWSDVAAVVVGLGAAVGTILVAVSANRTSKKAAAIAEDAKDIARQQQKQIDELRDAQARILGKRLRKEIVDVASRAAGLIRQLESAVSFAGVPSIANGGKLLRMLEEASMPLLPGARAVEDRIHNLPDVIGVELAALIGAEQTLEERVKSVKARLIPPHESHNWTYTGSPTDLRSLKHHIEWVLVQGGHLATKFIAFENETDRMISAGDHASGIDND